MDAPGTATAPAPDAPPTGEGARPRPSGGPGPGLLVLGALGVVFGDIGTSPIYALQTLFDPSDPHPVAVSAASVRGIVSLVFWSVMIIVTFTYVLLVMRADNHGEGGIMALITQVRKLSRRSGPRVTAVLAGLGIFGASLFFGDSMITPAISVLSAVEGLRTVEPTLDHLVVPVTAVIIVLLFMGQRYGTAVVGRLFGPVMVLWFLVLAALGVAGIVKEPAILEALSPTVAAGYVVGHPGTAFFALAAVVLAVTGAEALFADMGHFGRTPIVRAWLGLVLPALTLCYLGQGALILGDHQAISSPFFLLAPGWARLPLVLLATAATVIASQAVITGAFSVAHQAVQLGYLPRLRILHTSEHRIGQIYVPWINWLLMAAVLLLVFSFESSTALAYAYGVAVTGTITITTLLFLFIARVRWGWPAWALVPLGGVLLTIDLLFFGANLTKIAHGAWLPLLIGIAAYTVLTTWQSGRRLVTERREREEGSLQAFVDALDTADGPELVRVPGTAVFLNRNPRTAPLAMRANVEHNHVLHEQVVILSIVTVPVPHVSDERRVEVDDLGHRGDGIAHVTARFGYLDSPDVPSAVALARSRGLENPVELGEASYFLSTIELVVGDGPGMPAWRKRLFVATSAVTADAAAYFRLPRDRTVVVGSRIEV